ncbi:MAG: N-acetylglucosamine-6-phosphate deacetylase [Treponema sp.]|jgi:N-acetylglucosamine-6-phosphate deacetylase|nr:N-acetylglucosamine-6-phosphate deacetylase [Treponema sp.]
MSNAICFHNGTVLTGFGAMDQCAVLVEDSLIFDIFSEKRFQKRQFAADVQFIDVEGAFIAPGLIDTHIHGIGGHGTEDSIYCLSADRSSISEVFCDDEDPLKRGTEAVLAMSELLATWGVTAFNPTLYPCEPALLLRAIKAITAAMGKEKGARIMGLHLEGPFISAERLGVQRPETVRPVDLGFMEELWQASEGHIVNMTVAPELKGMRELALLCIKKGIVLQAGHTNATYENMIEGMQAGILHSTHLFNAMSSLNHRSPNTVGAILIHNEMSCEIIADNFHVHPNLLQLLMRDKPIEKIVLVTDGLKPTEQKETPLFANGEEVVYHDGAFHRASDDVIAGSGLTMIKGIQNLIAAGFSLVDAIKTASLNPAQIMRYTQQGAIIPGKFADISVFDKSFNVRYVMIGGKIVYNAA